MSQGVWSVVRVLNVDLLLVTPGCCAGSIFLSATGPELWGTKLAWRFCDQWVVVVYFWSLSCNCLSLFMFGQDILYVTRHIIDVNCCNAGVGVYEKEKAATDWTVNTHVFDNILKNLNLVLTHHSVEHVLFMLGICKKIVDWKSKGVDS